MRKTVHTQCIENLKGEIAFREKLAIQHVTGELLLRNYINKNDHDKIMLERVNRTFNDMERFKNLGVDFSTFIELGAERGQRSLVLRNDFEAEGFAIDISFAQLGTLDYWKSFFNKPKEPIRICCDAYHLPFQNNTIKFAFCYEFLHHFPSMEPIVKEIYRVLSKGYFYFDDEPLKRFSLKLYKRKVDNKPTTKLKKYLMQIESLVADFYKDEEEHRVIENHDISLSEWLDALRFFKNKDVYVSRFDRFSSKMDKLRGLKKIFYEISGGHVQGLCRKELHKNKVITYKDIFDLLGCPNCTIPSEDNGFNRPPLLRYSDHLKCELCKDEFPIIDNIIILLPREEMKKLYPQFIR